MLMRNALNASSEMPTANTVISDVTKVDKALAQQARDGGYLPQKMAAGKIRRLTGAAAPYQLVLRDWNTLATLYEHILPQAGDSDALSALINESDNKLLSKDLHLGTAIF
jgi:hypothetical protein